MKAQIALGYATTPLTAGSAEPGLFTTTSKSGVSGGIFLYQLLERTDNGVPVFGKPLAIGYPKGIDKRMGAVFQTADGVVHGWFYMDDHVLRTVLDVQAKRFVETPNSVLKVEGLPRKAQFFGVMVEDSGAVNVMLGLIDDTPQRPTEFKTWRDPNYRPFDGAGVYRGGWPFAYIYGGRVANAETDTTMTTRLVTPSEKESLLRLGRITSVNLGPGHEHDIVTGSWFTNIHYYPNPAETGLDLQPHLLVSDERGIALRMPSIHPSPTAYPNPQTGLSDLFFNGEGPQYYSRFTGRFKENGAPLYTALQPVLERDVQLYAGALPVINAADFDGDGVLDIVAGNSEGFVLYFHNAGSNDAPEFDAPQHLEAGGVVIHIYPGYNDVQGPQEAPWGYACPTVADWNEDGLADILMSSPTAQHEVLLNVGSKGAPKLAASQLLYCRGLDLHGTWRVRPGVAKLAGRMAYVALDDDDEFHLYWKIDDFNVEDGGKLKLDDGSAMSANFLPAGATGRSKITLVDWDRDGVTDMIVATPRHGSVPNKVTGLPQSKGLKGAAVLFLKNVGSDAQPVFKFPGLFAFRGKTIYLGQHSASAAVWDIGQPGGPDLLASDEGGSIIYYARKDLTWDSEE